RIDEYNNVDGAEDHFFTAPAFMATRKLEKMPEKKGNYLGCKTSTGLASTSFLLLSLSKIVLIGRSSSQRHSFPTSLLNDDNDFNIYI
ncbi:unnamed protein product, partial [Musa textilis]